MRSCCLNLTFNIFLDVNLYHYTVESGFSPFSCCYLSDLHGILHLQFNAQYKQRLLRLFYRCLRRVFIFLSLTLSILILLSDPKDNLLHHHHHHDSSHTITKWDPQILRSLWGSDSQQPVDGDEQADVLRGQTHGGQDQQHGDQSSAGNTGGAHTGQGGRHTGGEEMVLAGMFMPGLCVCEIWKAALF